MKVCFKKVITVLGWQTIALFSFFIAAKSAAQLPETLEEKVEILAISIAENEASKKYFIDLGPEVVPIVTEMLLRNLSEGSSPEAAAERIIMEMPPVDQKRVRYQIGLIAMQGAALQYMDLAPKERREALNSLYQAMRSPYQHSRKAGLYAVAYGVGCDGIEQILPLLNDPIESNRVIAAQLLSKIGDASTAERIEIILEQRRQGLTEEEVDMDWSFRHGFEAIKTLKDRTSTATRIPPQSTPLSTSDTPVKQSTSALADTPLSTVEESKSSLSILIGSVAIIGAVIVGIVLYLLRRKKP